MGNTLDKQESSRKVAMAKGRVSHERNRKFDSGRSGPSTSYQLQENET